MPEAVLTTMRKWALAVHAVFATMLTSLMIPAVG
jgi:hypothetical protein